MNKLAKFTTQAALNMDVALDWEVKSAVSLSDDNTHTVTIAFPYSHVKVLGDYDFYYSFSLDSSATVNTSNDLWLAASSVHDLRIPWGRDISKEKVMYLLLRRKTTNATSVRVVLC